jgi:hypothetical protein
MYGITSKKNRIGTGSLMIATAVLMPSSMSSLMAREVMGSTSTDPRTVAPSTISQGGGNDFGTQAALQIPRTLQSTDLVNSLAIYEVTFITSTTGVIDKIEVQFMSGINIASAGVIERVGIGGGTLLKSDTTITYDVTTPVSIPAGTFIRLEMFGIKNPINPSTTFTAMITTRDSGGNLIDGPSQTNVYTIKKIVSSDLADGSVTSTKPADSYQKRVTVNDSPNGHTVGWDPNGATTTFTITEPAITRFFTSYVGINLQQAGNVVCVVTNIPNLGGSFSLACITAPPEDSELHYVVENLPPHVIL